MGVSEDTGPVKERGGARAWKMGITDGFKRYVEARINRIHRGNPQGVGKLNRRLETPLSRWKHWREKPFICQCQGVGDEPLSKPLVASEGGLS